MMPYSDQVDAGPARRHVQALLAGGMSISQIQFASGVNRTGIRVLLGDFPNRTASRQIRKGTAERLLRTRLNRGASIDGLVPAAGTRRRLRALQAIGCTGRDLAARLGSSSLQYGRQGVVRAENAQRVMALYDELQHTAGPSSRAREHARRRGWLPPAWWDEDAIDDPRAEPVGIRDYTPDGTLIDDVTLPRADRVSLMTRRGLDPISIAERIGTRTKNVRRDLRERPGFGCPSCPQRFTARSGLATHMKHCAVLGTRSRLARDLLETCSELGRDLLGTRSELGSKVARNSLPGGP